MGIGEQQPQVEVAPNLPDEGPAIQPVDPVLQQFGRLCDAMDNVGQERGRVDEGDSDAEAGVGVNVAAEPARPQPVPAGDGELQIELLRKLHAN